MSTAVQRRQVSLPIGPLKVVSLAAGSVALGFAIAQPRYQILLVGLVWIAAAVFLALRNPLLTVGVLVILESIRATIGDPYEIGGLTVRFSDPVVIAILVVVFFRWIGKAREGSFGARAAALGLLIFWIGVVVVVNLPRFGINTLTELRTYYQPLVLVPYLALVPMTMEKRIRFLKQVAIGSVWFLVIGVIRLVTGVELQLGVRVVSASEALGLLYALVVIFLFSNSGLIGNRHRLYLRFFSIASGGLILLTAHRSVWLAAAAVLLTLFALKQLRLGNGLAQLAAVGLIGVVLAILALGALGGGSATSYATDRAQAFVDPAADPTSNWREYLWQQSLSRIQISPLFGAGLGRYFDLTDPSGQAVTTSPHNLYISIAYEFGIPGLLFYIAFVIALLQRAWLMWIRNRRNEWARAPATLAVLGIVVIVAAHAFYVAYPIENDWMTWIYVGVAVAIPFNKKAVEAPESSDLTSAVPSD
jgi:O-antigen ligase